MKGRPIVTIFHNEQNLYTVLKIKVEETSENYTEKNAVVTGYFPKLHSEEQYVFYGTLKKHPKYGLQFVSTHYRKDMPKTKQGIIQYLSSELFKGIGKKTAEKIVETLGEDAISRILENPSLLDTVPKLSSDKAKLLYDKLVEHQGLEKVMVALNEYGFGPQLAIKIYQTYKEKTLEIITNNPYRLVEDVEGIGFGRADELGFKLGIQGNHPDRIKAGCLYKLETDCLQEGHSFLYREALLSSVKKLLETNQYIEIPLENIDNELLKLEEEGKIIVEEDRIYIPSIFFSEKGLTTKIKQILAQRDYEDQFPDSEFFIALGELEDRLGIDYAPSQRKAIQTALLSPMLILTGGPGTGKTTVIKGIVELYAQLHGLSLNPNDYRGDEPFPIILAAPTGRAAKRMSESTGLPAVTIHRLLGWNGVESFEFNEDNPIDGRLIIIDEMSMVDIWLAHHLFKALPEKIQVVLVGDEDQLPSVGPGQVLKDLLASNVIPTVRLTDIYRQENGSSIVELAHQIKNGTIPPDLRIQRKDRSFIRCTTAQMADVIKQIVTLIKEKGFTKRDIQVLAPMYRGPAGIDQLNQILQELLNPNSDRKKRELAFSEVTYRVGDKVLQLVNRPENQVFNGDIGEIVAIFYSKENEEKQDQLVVSYDGNEVIYTKQDLNQITLAYCCSIHKSQGSEFPIVILPVVRGYYRMLRRNLIYTAVTRSKNKLILCGEEEAFQLAVMRTDDSLRNSSLKERLMSKIEQPDSLLSYEEELMKTDPMIGMGNTTPYDFLDY
ncbi:ATP-dependent RecD-like DNA helicase [Fervidibacillus halotolerans]|uniref:ATP-dependent RecD2 DNA helicase n=1 Tax=Fervidibacillus halotolerans TaxID=2980027 RepID=A0A9E8S1W7_9BACI|nr:ATP-dependent RecD-like DNA helicase [Fervidibacillus halotolerans]WAA13937.1 ATP-dependent RecD-like DNA helicase [Fervidibacillus halotolerans]